MSGNLGLRCTECNAPMGRCKNPSQCASRRSRRHEEWEQRQVEQLTEEILRCTAWVEFKFGRAVTDKLALRYMRLAARKNTQR